MEESFLKFEFDVFKRLNRKEKSSLVSPYSIGICFSYLSNLVKDENTRNEIQKVLHCDKKKKYNEIIEEMRNLESSIENEYNKDNIKTANILFTDKMNDEIEVLEEEYLPNIVNLTLINSRSSTINKTVKERTGGRISRIMNPIINYSMSSFFMTSVSHFESGWSNNVKEHLGECKQIFQGFHEKNEVEMVIIEGTEINLYKDKKLRMIEIPFSNEEFSFMMIKTKKKSARSFYKMIEKMNFEQFSKIQENKKKKNIQIIFPKFDIETDTFNINDYLREIGIKHKIEINTNCHMNQIIQKCSISINCEGCINVIKETRDEYKTKHDSNKGHKSKKTKKTKKSKKESMIFNRPFIFFIVKHKPNIIIHSGVMLMPKLQGIGS